MGNKIPYDLAMDICGINKNESIYNLDKNGYPCPNRWGYRYNVSHPTIRPLYAAYHKHIGVPENIHLTHAQRLNFESAIDRMIAKQRSDTSVQQSHFDGETDTGS